MPEIFISLANLFQSSVLSVAFKSVNGKYKQENKTKIRSHQKNTLHLFLRLDNCLFQKGKGNVQDSTVQDFNAHKQ